MPEMSLQERLFCRSRPWRYFTSHVVLPWALQGHRLEGEVLELGSGSGAMAARLLELFPAAVITATDYDEAMVALTRESLTPFGSRARARRADAASLPFGDGSFDAVVSFLMLHHVGSWERALAESARVMRPGGKLIGYDLLDNLGTTVLHRLGRAHGERLIRSHALEPALRRLPFAEISVRRTAGVLARFHATRS